MNAQTNMTTNQHRRMSLRSTIIFAMTAIVIIAMALNTKVVRIGSDEDVQADVFSPEEFGQSEFPKLQADIETRAVDAATLAAAIADDKAAASEKYGVAAGIGPVMPVKFTGVVGDGKSGVYRMSVDGLPDSLLIRVQTGPAINGTDLRDSTGTITFGQFTNQIEYQDAGSALNNQVKLQVLAPIDTSEISGKTISVVGVFKLINTKSWLVTPVRLAVE